MRFSPSKTGSAVCTLWALVAMCLSFTTSKAAAQFFPSDKSTRTWSIAEEETSPEIIDTAAIESGVDPMQLWEKTKETLASVSSVPTKEISSISTPGCREDSCLTACRQSALEEWYAFDIQLVTSAACQSADRCECNYLRFSPPTREPTLSNGDPALKCLWRSSEDSSPNRRSRHYAYEGLELYGGSVDIARLSSGVALTQAGFYSSLGAEHFVGLGLGLLFPAPFGSLAFECFYIVALKSTHG